MVSFSTNRCDTNAYSDIYAARVNAQGEVLDTDGFPVCTSERDQRRSRISYGNSSFLVIWQDERNLDSTGYDVYGARVTSDGTVLDSDGIGIGHFSYSEKAPDVSWTGETFLAIWEAMDFGQSWDISGVRIDTLGEVLDSTPLSISTSCDAQLSASSGWSGLLYLAIWEGNGDLYGTRVDRFGNLLDSTYIQICSAPEDQKHPALVWGEESFFAVWEDFRNLNFDVYGARIDSFGEVLDPSSLPINADTSSDQVNPAIAFDGENYLVTWQRMLDSTGAYYQIEGLRISSMGEPVDPQPFSISSGDKDSYPRVAFGGGRYLVVWLDAGFYDIHGALVDTDGTVNSQFGIKVASGLQQNPVVASDGSDFLVAWEDFGTHWPDADIVATRVTFNGDVLDPAGITVSMTSDVEQLPSVTFDGNNYVVVWKRSVGGAEELHVTRVTPEGVVLDPNGIFISDISHYSGTSISFGPLSDEPVEPKGQSFVLYSKYQAEPYNSHRIFGALFWGEPEPNLPPEPFSLLLPVDKDTVRKPIFLDWEDAPDPNPSDQVSYVLHVSSSQQFNPESTSVVDSLTSSECYVSPEKDSLIYWWKVEAEDRWGEIRWSNEIFSFDLENYGDVNGDGTIDAGDVVFLLNFLFRGGPSPQPLSAGDTNGDCEVSGSDVVYLINYLYKGGPGPKAGCA